ncbi:MAG: ABC transporter substrate-binding protein [Deltaproteobacteria bacterium]|nr:ABC transporter substrate-binding protein [Deltaproteobacteria bacterium]
MNTQISLCPRPLSLLGLRVLIGVTLLLSTPVGAQAPASKSKPGAQPITLGYLGLKTGVHLGFLGLEGGQNLKHLNQGTGHYSALEASKMAVNELNLLGRYYQLEFRLAESQAETLEEVQGDLQKLRKNGVRFFIVDLPEFLLTPLVSSTQGQGLYLFNVSATNDNLRNENCAPHLFHTIPSRAMLADALAQYLMKRGWRNWLLVKGPLKRDDDFAKALQRAATRFGATVVDTRLWKDQADISRSAEEEFPLFTSKANYDVVVMADEESNFGELMPYHTYLPRPVAGTQGLTPQAWFWGLSQWGATQLNVRFLKHAGRKMTSADWAAWVALTAVGEAMAKGGATTPEAVHSWLLQKTDGLQGYKGITLSFRPWNNQLRQPVFLVTERARISTSPQEGFLHPTSTLDTLGFDVKESRCKF